MRISQRTTLAHWLMSTGRSRHDCTQRANAAPITVSLVGRTTSGSSSFAVGSGNQPTLAITHQPVVSDDRHLLGEALDVLGLLREIAERDEQRKIAILVPRRLDAVIKQPLHPLPDAIAPRPDDHAATHAALLGPGRPSAMTA